MMRKSIYGFIFRFLAASTLDRLKRCPFLSWSFDGAHAPGGAAGGAATNSTIFSSLMNVRQFFSGRCNATVR
jgi:hypothetical protein